MSRQVGRGGMGSHKHGVSGTAGPNRRGLWMLGFLINRLPPKKARQKEAYSSVQELMKAERTKKRARR